MPYTPKTWENKPSTASPINATNLNHMEGGIKTNDDNIVDAQNAILTLQGEMLQAQGDITALETLVDSIFPVDTETGNPAVITDAFGGACKSLKLTLEPIQSGSGTPSPQNVRPISGRTQSVVKRTGKNLYNVNAVPASAAGITATVSSDGTLDLDGASTGIAYFSVYVKVPKSNYVVSLNNSVANNDVRLSMNDLNGNYFVDTAIDAASKTLTISNKSINLLIIYVPANKTINHFKMKIQLEVGSTATPYEPYNGESITIQLGQTVYGGVLDVTTGILTIDKSLVIYDGSQDENWDGSQLTTVYRAGIGLSNAVNDNGASNYLPYLNNWSSDTEHFYIYNNAVYAFIAVQGLASFKEYLAEHNLQIWYKLATPTTVQLTAEEVTLLHGDNVLTTDADSIDVEYSADIALYIAKKIAEGSQNNRSLSKGGSSDEEVKEEVKEEEIEIKEAEPLTKEVR